jgi:hypothetical protein
MEQCHACGEEFKVVSSHYAQSPCGYPELPNRLKERAEGELAGDGSLDHVWRKNGNSALMVKMAGKSGLAYLQDLHRTFGSFSTGEPTSVTRTNSSQNWEPLYCWLTTTHPFFNTLAKKWYKERGGKRFPRGLEITPRFLKAWYCGDGNLDRPNLETLPRSRIAVASEYDNSSLLENLFKPTSFSPNVSRGEKKNGRKWLSIDFSVKETAKLLRYMGNPAPGYGYKWEHPDLSPEEKTEQPFC